MSLLPSTTSRGKPTGLVLAMILIASLGPLFADHHNHDYEEPDIFAAPPAVGGLPDDDDDDDTFSFSELSQSDDANFGVVFSYAAAAAVPPVLRPGIQRRNNAEAVAAADALRQRAQRERGRRYVFQAQAYTAEGLHVAAAEAYGQAFVNDPTNYNFRLDEGRAWMRSSHAERLDRGKACFADVVTNQAVGSAAHNEALDELTKAMNENNRLQVLSLLGPAPDGGDAGKMFGEAFELNPREEYAFSAAQSFAGKQDLVRAAAMYRKFLELPANRRNAIRRKAATDWLQRHNFAPQAVWPHLRTVKSSYTETNGANVHFLEEDTPKHPVWPIILRAVKNYIGFPYGGKDRRGEVALFEYQCVRSIGFDCFTPAEWIEFRIQSVGYYVSRSPAYRKDAKLIHDLYVSISLDPVNDRRTTYPLVEQIQKRQVLYLKTADERQKRQLSFGNGRFIRGRQAPQMLDTSQMSTAFSGRGWAIYVMSPDGALYVDSHKVSRFHHSSFLAGSPVAGAGEIEAVNGEVRCVTNKTGHYHAGPIHLVQTLEQMGQMGADLSRIQVKVGGMVGGKMEVKDWIREADEFVDAFRNRPAQFKQDWFSLGFDPNIDPITVR